MMGGRTGTGSWVGPLEFNERNAHKDEADGLASC